MAQMRRKIQAKVTQTCRNQGVALPIMTPNPADSRMIALRRGGVRKELMFKGDDNMTDDTRKLDATRRTVLGGAAAAGAAAAMGPTVLGGNKAQASDLTAGIFCFIFSSALGQFWLSFPCIGPLRHPL